MLKMIYTDNFSIFELALIRIREMCILIEKPSPIDFKVTLNTPEGEKDWSKQGVWSVEDFIHEVYNDDPPSSLRQMLGDPEVTLAMERSIVLSRLEEINPDLKQLGIRRLAYSQAMVMFFAFLDSFLADTLRVICKKNPKVLKKNKKLTWEEILSFGDWNQLLDNLIERFLYDFGLKSLKERIKFLLEKMKLPIKIPKEDLNFIVYGENIRHIITHNAGKISQKFKENTRKNDLTIGELFPIDIELVDEIYSKIRKFGYAVFDAVINKFFKEMGE